MRPTLTNLLPIPQIFVSSSPALPTTSMSTNSLVININTEAAAALQPTKTNVNIKNDMENQFKNEEKKNTKQKKHQVY